MPTYEYACSACGNEWDQVQRITEAPIEVCPKCGKSSAHRLISRGTNFILKGGGWYSDLYSSSKGPAKTESESSAPEGGSKSEGASDGKAATPAASTPAAGAPSSPSSATPSASASSTTSNSSSTSS